VILPSTQEVEEEEIECADYEEDEDEYDDFDPEAVR
jgi:hypothetical protein